MYMCIFSSPQGQENILIMEENLENEASFCLLWSAPINLAAPNILFLV